jgi:hypothetical protein
MHCQQGGEVWAWNGLLGALEGSQVVSSHFWALLCTGLTGRGHRSNRSECWSCAHVGHRSDRWWWPVWPVWAKVVAAVLFSSGLHAFVRRRCISSGELAFVQGGLFVVFRALFRWFALFAWALFCLGCVQPLPLPKGSKTCLLQVILLFAFVCLSIACWSFFLLVYFFSLMLLLCGCCQCTHQGGDWGPCVVRGLVDGCSWCDEWLTMLCGLILG